MTAPQPDVEVIVQQDRRLGRQKVHDERSRAFPMQTAIDRTSWRDKAVRIYDPIPNPNQRIGCCSMVAKCSQLNAVGNRVTGRILDMADAERGYARNTEIDPFPGTYPPDDTGSSGLASCKTAQEQHGAGPYTWEFRGADGVIQQVQYGRVMSVGTWWHDGMFGASGGTYAGLPIVTPTGGRAGGHQYAVRGYDVDHDRALARCWWGGFRDFWISRTHLDQLLRDGGDAHWQTAR